MFNQFEPNVKATITFLKLLKVKVNNNTVNETLQNHPDWPSLLCIGDALNKWNIQNGAGKIDVNKIDELPLPFIALTNNGEYPLSIVTEVNENTIHYYSKNYNSPLTETKDNFLKALTGWTGIYLLAETTENSGEKDFIANKRKAITSLLISVSFVGALLLLSAIFLYHQINQFNNSLGRLGIYFQYAISLAGVVIAALLLWYEVDKNNPILQKVCTGITKGDCNAILTGKQAKVCSWLSWSEVGLFYFTGNLLVILFSGTHLANAISLLAWLSILALPYTIFSVYYQWQIAKQWCVLCLAVQGLLLLGAGNIFIHHFLASPFLFSQSFVCKAILLYLLPALAWYVIKPSILKLQETKNIKREYLRIKFNVEIFDTLLKKQKAITVSADGLGIKLGNPNATNTLIKVCNPYCGPCAKAHSKIEELLEQNKNVKAKIIFTTPNDETNPAIHPVTHLLAIAEENNGVKIKQALDDWYLSNTKDYAVFEKKYPMNGEVKKQGHKIEAMDRWCKAMEVRATPTIFLNGYQLPDAYNIEDLQYFLLE